MKKSLLPPLAGAFLVIAVTGCAQFPNNVASDPSGRYFQVHHPIANDKPVYQVTLPNANGCRAMLSWARNSGDTKSLTEVMRCTRASVSDQLPYRATIRNTAYDYILDVEANTSADCSSFLDGAMLSDGSDNLELVKDCELKKKTS